MYINMASPITHKVSYIAMSNNTRLTDFSGTKELVLQNAIKNVPFIPKEKKEGNNTSLRSFF